MKMTGDSIGQIGKPWCPKPGNGQPGKPIGKQDLEPFGRPWGGKDELKLGGRGNAADPRAIHKPQPAKTLDDVAKQVGSQPDPRAIHKPEPVKSLDDLIKQIRTQPDPRMYQD